MEVPETTILEALGKRMKAIEKGTVMTDQTHPWVEEWTFIATRMIPLRHGLSS